MALEAMRALHELGCDVPGDVSVAGFDDTTTVPAELVVRSSTALPPR
jgi:DNA-binding LacI/PurR family transcriptional regulator